MFFWNKICGLIAIFFILAVSAIAQDQNNVHFQKNNFHFLKKSSAQQRANFSVKKEDFDCSLLPVSFLRKTRPQTISSDFSTCQYGFFCKEELKMEKATKIPIRIRLGSLQQCNYYEGKQ
jgi:hypothetical protein